ncbi:helix-turn-helix domain-containing protein [Streptomyces albipurpureus]|uniref:Helix-turn-helix domain-containing protein n=1 Tax=Streptomyces albipurpureus TaxID=2897419 RepID=A0ABT0UNJ3_9ACTN|nr:helix-turn-helix domain-containing protein [Streptomyces sp. CWNU-1]MCM2390178.1 helix-turn-helix domain-containing protein [Streptomyces sp. CWNU-1]
MPPGEPQFPNPPLDAIKPGTLLTVADAAAHFGVKPGTIRQWAHRGKITHVPIPGPRLYHLRTLALAERDAWQNGGADRAKRGGRNPDWKPCTPRTTPAPA